MTIAFILAPMHKQAILFSLILLAFWLGGCDQSDTPNPDTQPVVVETPTATPAPTPASTTVPITSTNDVSTIVIWIPATLDRQGDSQLATEISTLNVNYPNLEIRVEAKEVLGQGGILSYLRTGRNVAPTVLPDLIVLPTDQLANAGTEGLIVPLDNLLTAEDQAALFPIGQSLGQIDGQWLGYPFILTDIMQSVYDTTVFTQTLPTDWNAFLELEPAPQLLFSADGREGGLLLLQLYLSLANNITNESGQLILDETLLATALTQLDVAQNNGLLAEAMTNLSPSDDFWENYRSLPNGIAFVTAGNYLQNAVSLPSTHQTGIIPSVTIPRATGYAFAVSTLDTNEQAVVAELLAQLIAPATLSQWSYQNSYLPARADTLARWATENNVNTNPIQTTLEQAIPYPVAVDSTIVSSLSQAVYAVLTENISPQTAASNALSKINQP